MQARVWLVHKHPSRIGMQLKVPVYKKCVHSRKFVVPSTVAALAVSLSKNCDESEEERARSYSEAKSGRLEKRPYHCVRWDIGNLTHFLGLNELFQHMLCHPFHTYCWSVAHGRPSQKHLPRLLTVMHTCRLSVQGHEMHVRHTLWIRTPSTSVNVDYCEPEQATQSNKYYDVISI